MVSRLRELLTRARDILQTEGLTTLLGRSYDFMRSRFFQYGNYYLYEYALKERNEADFMPRVQDFTLKVICTNEEADELAVITGYDFRRRFVNARKSLDQGAIAFCVFVNSEIAHISWVGMTYEAKGTFDALPYRVNFSNKEACTGGTVTIPEYRGKGLMVYGYFKRFEFLREKGILVSRNAVAVTNVASQRAHSKFAPRIYAEARYLKLLWWKYWKETPVEQNGHRD